MYNTIKSCKSLCFICFAHEGKSSGRPRNAVERKRQHGMFAVALRQQGRPYPEFGEPDTAGSVREHEKPQRREPSALWGPIREVQHSETVAGLGERRIYNQRVGRRRVDAFTHRVATR